MSETIDKLSFPLGQDGATMRETCIPIFISREGMMTLGNNDFNQVILSGIVHSPVRYSHMVFGEHFYTFELMVNRKSGFADRIPLMVSEKTVPVSEILLGMYLEVQGQYRSFNQSRDGKSKLILTVFVKKMLTCEMPGAQINPVNSVFLDGYVSTKPYYRRTPLGREITEMMMAVNRRNASDYIPCICWGSNARRAMDFPLGTHVRIWGRIQSRLYRKKILTNAGPSHIFRTAYEISIGRLEVSV